MVRKLISILLLSLSLNSPASYAQCNPLEDPFCEDPDNPIPLDEGALLLIGAASIAGLWKLNSRKQSLN